MRSRRLERSSITGFWTRAMGSAPAEPRRNGGDSRGGAAPHCRGRSGARFSAAKPRYWDSRSSYARGHRAELLCDRRAIGARRTGAGVVCHPLRIRDAVDVGARLRRKLPRRALRCRTLPYVARARARAYVRRRARARGCDAADGLWAEPAVRALAVQPRGRRGRGDLRGGPDALARAGVARERITVIPSGVDCGISSAGLGR